jgi:hypothetical protein
MLCRGLLRHPDPFLCRLRRYGGQDHEGGGERQLAIGTRRVADLRKAGLGRFHDATTTGDAELICKTIDELVEPNAVIQTSLPIDATGATTTQGGV